MTVAPGSVIQKGFSVPGVDTATQRSVDVFDQAAGCAGAGERFPILVGEGARSAITIHRLLQMEASLTAPTTAVMITDLPVCPLDARGVTAYVVATCVIGPNAIASHFHVPLASARAA